MKHSSIFNDQAAILKNEIYSNSIIPSKRTEMWRRVELHGDTYVMGGIFGDSLLVQGGDVYVRDAVYIRDNVQIHTPPEGKTWFHSVLASGMSITNVSGNARIRFSSDIHAKKVNLRNVIVYGNVVCEDIILEDCVVLGGVFARQSLTIANSIIGTFETPTLTQRSHIGILQPFAMCQKVASRDGKILSLMPFCQMKDGKASIYEMCADDIMEKTIQDQNGTTATWTIFSICKRVFDLSDYLTAIADNLKFIEQSTGQQDPDHARLDSQLGALDSHFFSFISQHFDIRYDIPVSTFMERDVPQLGSISTAPAGTTTSSTPASSFAERSDTAGAQNLARFMLEETSTGATVAGLAQGDLDALSAFVTPDPQDPDLFRIDREILIHAMMHAGGKSRIWSMLTEWLTTKAPAGGILTVRIKRTE
jgi:hypothetical protein